MESGIINFVGFSCTGGVLVIWAKETFGRNVEEDEGKEKTGIMRRLYNFINDLFHRLLPVAEEFDEDEEEIEQAWKAYVQHQESRQGKYKINV